MAHEWGDPVSLPDIDPDNRPPGDDGTLDRKPPIPKSELKECHRPGCGLVWHFTETPEFILPPCAAD